MRPVSFCVVYSSSKCEVLLRVVVVVLAMVEGLCQLEWSYAMVIAARGGGAGACPAGVSILMEGRNTPCRDWTPHRSPAKGPFSPAPPRRHQLIGQSPNPLVAAQAGGRHRCKPSAPRRGRRRNAPTPRAAPPCQPRCRSRWRATRGRPAARKPRSAPPSDCPHGWRRRPAGRR